MFGIGAQLAQVRCREPRLFASATPIGCCILGPCDAARSWSPCSSPLSPAAALVDAQATQASTTASADVSAAQRAEELRQAEAAHNLPRDLAVEADCWLEFAAAGALSADRTARKLSHSARREASGRK
jgi:hypothetical protein